MRRDDDDFEDYDDSEDDGRYEDDDLYEDETVFTDRDEDEDYIYEPVKADIYRILKPDEDDERELTPEEVLAMVEELERENAQIRGEKRGDRSGSGSGDDSDFSSKKNTYGDSDGKSTASDENGSGKQAEILSFADHRAAKLSAADLIAAAVEAGLIAADEKDSSDNATRDVLNFTDDSQGTTSRGNTSRDIVDPSDVLKESNSWENVSRDVSDPVDDSQETTSWGSSSPDVSNTDDVSQETTGLENASCDILNPAEVSQENISLGNSSPDISGSDNVSQGTISLGNVSPEISDSEDVSQETIGSGNASRDVSDLADVSQEIIGSGNASRNVSDLPNDSQIITAEESLNREHSLSDESNLLDFSLALAEKKNNEAGFNQQKNSEPVRQERTDSNSLFPTDWPDSYGEPSDRYKSVAAPLEPEINAEPGDSEENPEKVLDINPVLQENIKQETKNKKKSAIKDFYNRNKSDIIAYAISAIIMVFIMFQIVRYYKRQAELEMKKGGGGNLPVASAGIATKDVASKSDAIATATGADASENND